MNTIETYIKNFNLEEDAESWCRMKNEANRVKWQMFALVDGADENTYSVVDINTAIELGCGYKILGAINFTCKKHAKNNC